MNKGLLDTSVFVAAEQGRSLAQEAMPDAGFVSVISLAELEAGVLVAANPEAREQRLATLRRVAGCEVLAITEEVAHDWAILRTRLAAAGLRANANDLWIAATAMAEGLPVVTQDRDFDTLADLGGPQVIHL